MENRKQILGREGEGIAELYLKKKGFSLIERNYRCPLGKLDLIALDRKVFVEVKTRSSARSKKAALYFLSQKRLHDRDARFDVIGISYAGGDPVVEHIENAFEFS